MEKSVSDNDLLAALSAKDRRLFARYLEQVPLEAGQILFDLGKISHVYFPCSGVISKFVRMNDSDGVEAGMVGKEGMVPLCLFMELDKTPFRAVVQNPGQAWRMEAGAFKAMVKPGSHSPESRHGAPPQHGRSNWSGLMSALGVKAWAICQVTEMIAKDFGARRPAMMANPSTIPQKSALLVVACFALLPLSLLSAQQPQLRLTLRGDGGPVSSVAFSPDGKMLASGVSRVGSD